MRTHEKKHIVFFFCQKRASSNKMSFYCVSSLSVLVFPPHALSHERKKKQKIILIGAHTLTCSQVALKQNSDLWRDVRFIGIQAIVCGSKIENNKQVKSVYNRI